MPEMNENVPSGGAELGLERNGAAKEAAALLRTAATALLSAADIWTTSSVAAPARPAETATPPAASPATDKAPATPPPLPNNVRPSDALAEERFFSLLGKRSQDDQAPPPLPPSEVSIDVELARALEKRAAAALAQARASTPPPPVWPPKKLSLALQGGGSFGAFTW